MNAVTVFSTPSQPVTMMTTREVAGLVQKQHGNIKISAERLSEKGVIGTPDRRQFTHNNNTYTEYMLNKRDCFILIAQMSPQHIGVAIDAWGRTQQSLDELIAALDAFDVPEECEGMYVYAIRNTTTGNVKLGISRNPEKRLKQLQTGNDCTLELVAYRKAENSFQDESALHHAHSAAHIRGEWFNESALTAIAQ